MGGNVDVLRFRQEQETDDQAHARHDDRVPEAGIDIAGRGHDREYGGGQEAAEPAVADVVGQGEAAVADAGGEELHQPGRNRRVDQRHEDHQDGEQDHRHRVVDLGGIGGGGIAVRGDRLPEHRGEARDVGGDQLLADFHLRDRALRGRLVVVIDRARHQRRLCDVARGGEALGSRQLELERALARIGDNGDWRGGERRLQRGIGEVGDRLEDREIGQRRQQEAGQDDRLASDLVGQPAEQDEEGRADQERDGNQDLRRDRGHLQGLRQEEQGVELAAVPDDGFAGGGAEERKDGELQVGPLAERLAQRTLRASTFLLHAQEDRRFVELEPDPDRYDQQDGRQQERNTPTVG